MKTITPILARSAYAIEAAKSLRSAANSILDGRFEDASNQARAAAQCLGWLEREAAALLKSPSLRAAYRRGKGRRKKAKGN